MRDDTFFSFPLSILAYPEQSRRIYVGIDDSLARYANKRHPDASSDDPAVIAYCDRHQCEGRSTRWDAPGYILAADDLNVSLHGNVRFQLENLDRFREWHQSQRRSNLNVRVRADLVWDAATKRMPFRRFAVLCGLYARIGAKNYAKVSVEDLQRLAAGLASRDELKRHKARRIADRIDAGEILSADKIRYTVKRLVAESLVTRYTFNRGETFYAHPARHVTTESLRIAVLRSKAKRRGMEREDANQASPDDLEAYLIAEKKSQRI